MNIKQNNNLKYLNSSKNEVTLVAAASFKNKEYNT